MRDDQRSYIQRVLSDLNTDKNSSIWDERTAGRAPHKPLLLLSVMDGIAAGRITTPDIELTQPLIETFFSYWNTIMGSDRTTTVALPYYHMDSEDFWELQYKEGQQPFTYSPSLGSLQDRVAFAEMNEKLFDSMRDKEGRSAILELLLRTYFSEEVREKVQTISTATQNAFEYARLLESRAAEPFVLYHTKENGKTSEKLQQVQNRDAGFRLSVKSQYDYRCAICRTKVLTPGGASLVEGAHIVPWSESQNDDPRNGLALCRTHHWMFDKYLIGIQPDFTITISKWFEKEAEEVEGTLKWNSAKLLLPEDKIYYPAEEALKVRYKEYKNYLD